MLFWTNFHLKTLTMSMTTLFSFTMKFHDNMSWNTFLCLTWTQIIFIHVINNYTPRHSPCFSPSSRCQCGNFLDPAFSYGLESENKFTIFLPSRTLHYSNLYFQIYPCISRMVDPLTVKLSMLNFKGGFLNQKCLKNQFHPGMKEST